MNQEINNGDIVEHKLTQQALIVVSGKHLDPFAGIFNKPYYWFICRDGVGKTELYSRDELIKANTKEE
jgi:hypothetical protein